MPRTCEMIESLTLLRREIAVIGSGRRLDDEEEAAALLCEPEVLVLHWPFDEALLDLARERGHPRLLVVEGDEEPPDDWGQLEEWIRLPAERRDVQVRVAALRRRAAESPPRPILDGYDRLVFRRRWVALTPSDYKLVEPLVERFDQVVPYEDVVGRMIEADGAAPVAGRVRLTRLRRRIAPLGLQIRTVRPHGLALTPIDSA